MPFRCNLCPRRCNALRDAVGRGICRMPELPMVARSALHFDEEPAISGTRGSGTVFFSGCSLRCCYCQNEPISQGGYGKLLTIERLRDCFEQLVQQGAHNINLVNPTHDLHAVLDALREPLPVPVVYNTGGYELVESIAQLDGTVDVYLPDLKYIDSDSAARYSSAANYFEHASRVLIEMLRQQPEVILDDGGIMQRGVMVRHLILPGRAQESIRILDWIKQHLPGAWVSLMAQYTPMGRADQFPEINRRLTKKEYEQVVNHMMDIGLDDGYVQELSSADERYIPPFDLTGV